jgi:hypothetical protein
LLKRTEWLAGMADRDVKVPGDVTTRQKEQLRAEVFAALLQLDQLRYVIRWARRSQALTTALTGCLFLMLAANVAAFVWQTPQFTQALPLLLTTPILILFGIGQAFRRLLAEQQQRRRATVLFGHLDSAIREATAATGEPLGIDTGRPVYG